MFHEDIVKLWKAQIMLTLWGILQEVFVYRPVAKDKTWDKSHNIHLTHPVVSLHFWQTSNRGININKI